MFSNTKAALGIEQRVVVSTIVFVSDFMSRWGWLLGGRERLVEHFLCFLNKNNKGWSLAPTIS